MSTIADARAELTSAEDELKRIRASVEELKKEERRRKEESEKMFLASVPALVDALIKATAGRHTPNWPLPLPARLPLAPCPPSLTRARNSHELRTS
jgi:hypothetical protein